MLSADIHIRGKFLVLRNFGIVLGVENFNFGNDIGQGFFSILIAFENLILAVVTQSSAMSFFRFVKGNISEGAFRLIDIFNSSDLKFVCALISQSNVISSLT